MINKIREEIRSVDHKKESSYTETKDWTEGEADKMKDQPFRMTLLNSFKKLRNEVKRGMQDKIEQAREDLVNTVKALTVGEIMELAGLEAADEDERVKEIIERCEAEIESLRVMKAELNPDDYLKKTQVYHDLQNKTQKDLEGEEENYEKFDKKEIIELILKALKLRKLQETQDESDYLFQPQTSSKNLYLFNIS